MTNRLAESTSPYLQQHRDNPVGWGERVNDLERDDARPR
jgi:uncharacterized protein YyaL (SSP411 family)